MPSSTQLCSPQMWTLTTPNNLAITDHLPADIIRCLWVVQSLNIRFNERREDLYNIINLLKSISKFQVLDTDASLGRTRSSNVKALLESLSTIKIFESQKSSLLQQIKQIDSEIRMIHQESIRESVKLRLLLDYAKRFLNASSYQLIQILFSRFKNQVELEEFVDAFTNSQNSRGIGSLKTGFAKEYPNVTTPSTSKLNTLLKSSSSLQQPNDSNTITRFSDYDEEFRQLIKSSWDSRKNERRQSERDGFVRKQIALSIMAKNETFDRCFNLNGYEQPKMRLVIRNPTPTDVASSNKLKLRVANTKSNVESSASDSDFETSKSPPPLTPKLKLTIRSGHPLSKDHLINDFPVSNNISSRLKRKASGLSESSKLKINKIAGKNKSETYSSAGRSQASGKSGIEQEAEDQEEVDESVFCICRSGSSGKMIGCDDDHCKYGGWFHYKCLSIPINFEPGKRNKWYCPWCRDKHLSKQKPSVDKSEKKPRLPSGKVSSQEGPQLRPRLEATRPLRTRNREIVSIVDDIDSVLRHKKKAKPSDRSLKEPLAVIKNTVAKSSTDNQTEVKKKVVQHPITPVKRSLRSGGKALASPVLESKPILKTPVLSSGKITKEEVPSRRTLRSAGNVLDVAVRSVEGKPMRSLRSSGSINDGVGPMVPLSTLPTRSLRSGRKTAISPMVAKPLSKLRSAKKVVSSSKSPTKEAAGVRKFPNRAKVHPLISTPTKTKTQTKHQVKTPVISGFVETFLNDGYFSPLSDINISDNE
ncbi:hypothetical protein DASC09_011820 [Saccharomycopsis crataegensis]|uniref:PHD-type domain-containing protein n=1 Tax=Saccharomycopsis crataegensis TaxID=43959 RepID=A0AAV5QGZ0_9ASCO|nr:hypothetical protein DASC09_011820 [Saccharomycopsis crataegensis]